MNALLTPLLDVTPWLAQLATKTGRAVPLLQAHGLLAQDFPMEGVLLQAEDGSVFSFRHAFWVQDPTDTLHVAVFTEHLGYYELRLEADDFLQTLSMGSEEDLVRSPGGLHCVPFSPCPLCASEVEVVEDTRQQRYSVQCPSCGVCLGEPNGYSSRLDMARDWNRRA